MKSTTRSGGPAATVWLVTLVAVATAPGCFSPLSSRHAQEAEPFQSAGRDSELVFVRTRDHRYFYVFDRERGLCFFHAPLYGRKHLAAFDCATFPDYQKIMSEAGRNAPEPTAPTASPDAVDDTDVARTPEPAAVPEVGNTRHDRFRRAFVQLECSKRSKTPEPLEVILARFKLSDDDWDAEATVAERDDAMWNALSAEVDAACPEGTTPPPDSDPEL